MRYSLSLLFILAFFLQNVSQNSLDIDIPKELKAISLHTISVKIRKGNVVSFSKYQLDVPNSVTIHPIDVKNGHFTFEKQRAKVVWVDCPSTDEFTISLHLLIGETSGDGSFEHRFYYIEGDSKKEISDEITYVDFIAADPNSKLGDLMNVLNAANNKSNIEVAKNTGANTTNTSTTANTSSISSNTSEPKKTNISIPPSSTVTPTNTTSTSTATQVTSSNTTPVSLPEMKTYRVQIGSFSSRPSVSQFKGLSELFIKEEGKMYKVYVGNFTSKDDAVKRMSEIKTQGYSGFVVTFINGEKAK